MPVSSESVAINASPLLALDACDQIELLRSLYNRVVVPEEVRQELSHGGKTALRAGLTAAHLEWIEILPLGGSIPSTLLEELGAGEAAVIASALELGFRRVVMDERKGRKVATSVGLEAIGSTGILLQAKQAGLITGIKPCLDAMTSRGIWLRDSLITWTLRKAGEIS